MQPLLVYGPWSRRYDLGPGHPLTPRRFGPGIDLLRTLNDLAGGGPIRELPPEPASDAALRWVHDERFIDAVRQFSDMPMGGWQAGIGPGDTPAFAGMHEASAAVAGGSIRAMAAILGGDVDHAFHPGGGLHHALADRASGFCVYNDPALAIARARQDGLRVLYVDLDVHHGDGVQALHVADPAVLTFSIHQSGRTLFPGTGFVSELGEGVAAGTSLNLPLDPGTGEHGWLTALRMVLPEVAAAFRPDVVVSQHGADAHAWDPLANLRTTTTAMGSAARLLDRIAHRWAGGRWLATGGGGYDAYRVVPRVWSRVWLTMAHLDAPSGLPVEWRERWAAEAEQYGQAPLPERLDDLPNAGLELDATQELADHRAVTTASLVRELAVPALVRTAVDLGWWSASDDLSGAVPVAGPRVAATSPGSESRGVEVLDQVDAERWAALELSDRVVPPGDPAVAHELVLAGLRGGDGARVSAAVAGRRVVGAAVSAVVDGRQRLLALGVAPDHRRRGLATELLRRHLSAVVAPGAAWEAAEQVGERDPVEPLPRPVRAEVARRLLGGAGFRVERAPGHVGASDPKALVAHRS